jgi:hypothetical protein
MLTKKDISKLEEKFATKDDLKAFATKIDLVDFKDAILHEIKGLREDVTLVTGYKDEIEDHDIRINRIEKHLHLTPVTE